METEIFEAIYAAGFGVTSVLAVITGEAPAPEFTPDDLDALRGALDKMEDKDYGGAV